MNISIAQAPVDAITLDHIANYYGWHARVYMLVTYWDNRPIDATSQVETVEDTLGRLVNGRYYMLDDIFFSNHFSGVDIRVYFEREEDALMFKLAVS